MNDTLLKCRSFAKINLGLRILGKRSDGYHEIDTLFQTVSLHDDLIFTQRDDQMILLRCDDRSIPTDRTNLIMKAAWALKDQVSTSSGVDIHLTKRIPAQGGLGGASSNAAIAILALNQLWNLALEPAELEKIGRRIGADVPFFFTGGLARGRGTGKDISVLPDGKQIQLIIITPKAKVSTEIAYRALKAPSLTTEGSVSILSSSFGEPPFGEIDQWGLQNDFEGVIFEIEPEIERAKLALLDAGAQGGLLAGSGSSVFGIFENENARERALKNLKCETGWQVFPSETISRKEYSERLGLSGFPLLRSL